MPTKGGTFYITILLAQLLLSFSTTPSVAQFQSYPFKQFPLPKDLPNIERMLEDHLGYLWLGTVEGLYRFDGINYTLQTSVDPEKGLNRELVTCIYEDREQLLWVGVKKGLCRYDPVKRDFELFYLGEDSYPMYIHQVSDTTFIVQCRLEVYMFYSESNRWEKINAGFKTGEIYSLQSGDGDDLWIGADAKVRRFNLRSGEFQDYTLPVPAFAKPGERIFAATMFMDSHEQLWINTWHKGVMKLDTRSGLFESYYTREYTKKNYLLELFNSTMVEDKDGNIWMASTNKGINIYHQDTRTISHIPREADYANGLIGSDFVIASDRGKNIWVKSNRALHYLASKSPVLELKSNPESPIEDALIMRFLTPDYILIGTYFGLYGVNLESRNVMKLNEVLRLPKVHNAEFQMIADISINEDNTFWVATPQGLKLVEWNQFGDTDPEFNFRKLIPTSYPFMPVKIFPVGDSLILVKGRTNTSTLAVINTQTMAVRYRQFPDSMMINQIALYKNDTIIMGIRNVGLCYYHPLTESLTFIPWKLEGDEQGGTSPVFHAITPLANGNFAIATDFNGVLIFDPREKTLMPINVISVAKTNRVQSVTEDGLHRLWIQTLDHFLLFEPRTKQLSKTILSNSFSGEQPAYFLRDGKEIFCTYEGKLFQIEMDEFLFKSTTPKLYLNTIKARDHDLNWWLSDDIRIKYDDNFLTFDFTGLDYDNPQGILYWYRIPEISKEWQLLGNRTSISFGRISPGTYHFTVKAVNDAGLWSNEVHAPEITIMQPFWKSGWFLTAMAAIITGAVVLLLKLRKQKREAEIRLRNQIARDLHDDIGSTLSGIKIFSVIASGMSEENKELSSLLQQIRDKSDSMMQSMSDIVWSINPAHDSLHDMMIRLKQFMAEVLESQDIEVHYSAAVDLKNIKFELSHRKELYLTLKEIINNVAKYAECQHFYFDISKQRGEIVIVAKDDGKGMDEENVNYGNGLKNINTRMIQIGATVTRESSLGKGVKYEIHIPV
ncbi:MAG: hypothetical protein KBA14_07885 [Saprospiraceae bacterium]|nr:hypothetical protein [Saprospiraceae bacterium]